MPVSAPEQSMQSRLDIPREEMRAMGYRVIDILVDHLANPERAKSGGESESFRDSSEFI
jgi:hypothetical protein